MTSATHRDPTDGWARAAHASPTTVSDSDTESPIFEPWWRMASPDDRARAIFAATWLISIAYLASWIAHGWIPHDDGLLAQSAERFLRGQLPHRDFDEMYTGGLTMLHAAAFAALGTRLLALRIVLLAAAAIWVPIVFAIARRFAPPALAALATLTAVVWSLPNYSAAMPSWYNLFFATGGLLALLKYTETRRSRWLVVAGVCGGLSVLIKIVGVYFLAGAGLTVIYAAYHSVADHDARRQTDLAGSAPSAPTAQALVDSPMRNGRLGLAAALVSTIVVLAGIAALLRPAAGIPTYFYFMLPTAATCVGLIVHACDATRFSWKDCWRGIACVALGVAIVIVPFVAFYARAHALGPLYMGVLVLPARRYTFAMGIPTWPGPIPIATGTALLVTLPIRPRWMGVLIAAVILGSLAHLDSPSLRQVWDSRLWETARALLPLLAGAFAAFMVAHARAPAPERRAQAFAVVIVASLFGLVEYPFFGMIYFFYCAPLVVLAAVALFGTYGQPGGSLSGAAALAFFVVFAVGRMPPRSGGLMTIPRGGIVVGPPDSAEAQTLVEMVQAHSRSGYTFATPDCPEVYFLTGLTNPTRTMFDFFADTVDRTDRLLRMLAAQRITAITVNRQPLFSGGADPHLMAALAERYPDSVRFGRYTVRWQSDDRIPGYDAAPGRSGGAPARAASGAGAE